MGSSQDKGYHNAPHGAHRACHFHSTRLSVLAPLMDVQPRSDLAHEHGTTRRARSPALPENKALLLTAPSDLGSLLPSVAYLSDLHLVQAITVWHSITTPPPPSVLHAGILASHLGSSSFRVPQFRVDVFSQPLACLLYAGCLVGEPSLRWKQ